MKALTQFFQNVTVQVDKNRLAWQNRGTQFVVSLLRTVFLIGMSFVMVYPVLFILSEAFKGVEDVYDSSVVWLPKHYSLRSFFVALQMLDFKNSIVRTLQIVVPSTLLQLVSSLLAGYGFARFKFRGKTVLFAILIFTIIVPIQTYMIPLYVGFTNLNFLGIGPIMTLITGQKLNVLNSPVPFYLMAMFGAGIRSGLYIFMLRQFFIGMPKELDEAASIDGCGPLQVFTKVMIPNAIPMMVTILVFSLVWYWNDYYLSSMFFDALPPLSQKLADVSVQASFNSISGISGLNQKEFDLIKEGVMACGCLVTIIPPLVLYIFAQRYFTEGLERSGIVG
jgi:multiple sugar transport system permease protein